MRDLKTACNPKGIPVEGVISCGETVMASQADEKRIRIVDRSAYAHRIGPGLIVRSKPMSYFGKLKSWRPRVLAHQNNKHSRGGCLRARNCRHAAMRYI